MCHIVVQRSHEIRVYFGYELDSTVTRLDSHRGIHVFIPGAGFISIMRTLTVRSRRSFNVKCGELYIRHPLYVCEDIFRWSI